MAEEPLQTAVSTESVQEVQAEVQAEVLTDEHPIEARPMRHNRANKSKYIAGLIRAVRHPRTAKPYKVKKDPYE